MTHPLPPRGGREFAAPSDHGVGEDGKDVRVLLAEATARLAAAGVESPRVDAELLLAAATALNRTRLLTLDRVPSAVAATYADLVARRSQRVPLQHLTGTAPFRTLELAVGPGVFIPRPETELLVDAALAHLRGRDHPSVVDLCAGSGALALSVAVEVPGVRVVAVEKNPEALRWLARNAAGTPVEVVAGDVCDPDLLPALRGTVTAVVANPPYVPADTQVAAEVRADPAQAVFAGPDGLDLLPAVVARAADLLRAGGLLALEHDETHADSVPALFDDTRWTDVIGHRDLTGRPRYTVAHRR